MNRVIAMCALLLTASACTRSASWGNPTISFVERDATGKKVRELSLLLTDTPAKTCSGEDWKVAKPVRDPTGAARSPAYIKKGAELRVLLVSAVCDGYDGYLGTLKGSAFTGEHVQYGLGFSRVLGSVQGSYAAP